jgi:hypothetical protein
MEPLRESRIRALASWSACSPLPLFCPPVVGGIDKIINGKIMEAEGTAG